MVWCGGNRGVVGEEWAGKERSVYAEHNYNSSLFNSRFF